MSVSRGVAVSLLEHNRTELFILHVDVFNFFFYNGMFKLSNQIVQFKENQGLIQDFLLGGGKSNSELIVVFFFVLAICGI